MNQIELDKIEQKPELAKEELIKKVIELTVTEMARRIDGYFFDIKIITDSTYDKIKGKL